MGQGKERESSKLMQSSDYTQIADINKNIVIKYYFAFYITNINFTNL